MNQERIRERKGEYANFGTNKNAPGQHSHLTRLDDAIAKVRDFFHGEPIVGGFHPEDHIPLDEEIVLFMQPDPRLDTEEMV